MNMNETKSLLSNLIKFNVGLKSIHVFRFQFVCLIFGRVWNTSSFPVLLLASFVALLCAFLPHIREDLYI